MTPQEAELLNSLVERVNQTQLQEKDPDAEALLNNALGANPDAIYILSQSVLVQNIALEQARAQIAQLQQAQQAQMQQAQQQYDNNPTNSAAQSNYQQAQQTYSNFYYSNQTAQANVNTTETQLNGDINSLPGVAGNTPPDVGGVDCPSCPPP